MSVRSISVLLFCAFAGLAVAQAEPPQVLPLAEPSPAPDADSCTVANALARPEAYAFTHVVELKNNCPKPVKCEVWTDVDPTPRHALEAQPGQAASVLIRRGSPARTFKAEKACKY